MTTREQYNLAYQVLRCLQSHGFEGTYWGGVFPSRDIPLHIIGLAAVSLSMRYLDDPLEKPFSYRCNVASVRYIGDTVKWIYDPHTDGIPF